MNKHLYQHTAHALHRRVLNKQCTQADIVASYLARIAEYEPEVHAWSHIDPDQAMEFGRQADCLPPKPLAGVTVGIKDIIDTADMPTAYGSAVYQGLQPAKDAALITRLREAGALILGKTVTTEFAFSHGVPTRNPHALDHTPGGSSSGSAAAVAACMVATAISSQTGGSTIRPAAFCGVVGFKPTHGWTDSTGMKPLSPSSDTVGLHAHTVGDIGMLFQVLAPKSPPMLKARKPRRIAWFPGPHAQQTSPASRHMLEEVRARLLAAGIIMEPSPLEEERVRQLGECNRLVMAAEGARMLDWEYRHHAGLLGKATVSLIERGRATSDARYRETMAFIEESREAFKLAMRGFDALLTFSAPGAAPLASAGLGDSLFDRPWSALGVSCMNLPYGTEDGLPLGVQLVVDRNHDVELLQTALYIEALLAE